MRKFFFVLLYIFYCLAALLLAFELIYRTQIIDTYSPELMAYNSKNDIDNPSKDRTILTLGDSFTAGESYVGSLRTLRPDYTIINSGIVGTGIIQALAVAPKRINRFKPSITIYQIFVGNDLFNIRYPVNWKKGSFLRNAYWTLERYFRSLGFLAYRLSQYEWIQKFCVKSKIENNATSRTFTAFDADNYNAFAKEYITMDPSYLEETIFVSDKYKMDYNSLLKNLDKLASVCASDKNRFYILVIPHPSQINSTYFADMKILGARFSVNPEKLQANEYPFIEGIREKFKTRPNVYILNPMPFIKTLENNGYPVYFASDPHINAFGQKMLGEYVAGEIFEESRAN